MQTRSSQALVMFILAGCFSGGIGGSILAAPAARLTLERTAPLFTLPDLAGKSRTLTEFRGRPVALFFFCGCDACHRCAVTWADAQHSGSLPPALPTIIVFSGDSMTAHRFLTEAGLDASQTILLTDPQDKIADIYNAPVCPRVFVLNAQGKVYYTNNEPDTDPQTMPAAVLVSRIISAVRAAPGFNVKPKGLKHARTT